MLVTDLLYWKHHQHNDSATQYGWPKSLHFHHHEITSKRLSPTSLSPFPTLINPYQGSDSDFNHTTYALIIICLRWPWIFVMFILLEHKQGFLFIFLVLFSVSNLGVVNSRLNSRDPGRRHKIIVSRWSQQGISRSVGRQNNADFILKLLPDKGLLEKLRHILQRFLAVNRCEPRLNVENGSYDMWGL